MIEGMARGGCLLHAPSENPGLSECKGNLRSGNTQRNDGHRASHDGRPVGVASTGLAFGAARADASVPLISKIAERPQGRSPTGRAFAVLRVEAAGLYRQFDFGAKRGLKFSIDCLWRPLVYRFRRWNICPARAAKARGNTLRVSASIFPRSPSVLSWRW